MVLLLRLALWQFLLCSLSDAKPPQHNAIGTSSARRRNSLQAVDALHNQRLQASLSKAAPITTLRGGAISIDDDDDAGFLVQKVRNVIRSLLQSTSGSTAVQGILKRLVVTLEAVTGQRLMPLEKKRKKKKSSTTKKKASKVESSETTKKSKKKQSSSSSTAAQKHLTSKISSNNPNYRIQRELKAFLQDPPEHLTVQVGKNIRVWIVQMEGIGIYKGETFKLRIQFPANYPTRPPSVYFLPPHIPVHEHVYTNGDICLSLLGKDWRPTMTAQSIAHSILSILASASHKSLPMDNARHATNKPGAYQEAWVYHDDSC